MQVTIHNFQSIKDVSFEVKGLTVITGPNNTGKSACARALAGVFSNPRGHSYVRQGEKHTSVEVAFDDGNKVKWEKGKGVNRYEINGNAIDKVGSKAPDELEEIGVLPVDVDGKEVWPQVARQFEQVFLLDMPPSVLSSALSDVDTIQALEQASSLARSDVKSIKSRMKVKHEDLDIEKGRIQSFFDLSDAEVLTNKVKDLEGKIEEVSQKIETLQKVSAKRDDLLKQVETLSGVSSVDLPMVKAGIEEEIEELIKTLRQRNKHNIEIGMIGVGLESYPTMPDMSTAPDPTPWIKVYDKRSSLLESIALLSEVKINLPSVDVSLDEDIKLCEEAIKLKDSVTQIKREATEVTDEVDHLKQHIGDACPLCESVLS
jgi:DNA repair ATPase RecN